jgi:protein SCO1/2
MKKNYIFLFVLLAVVGLVAGALLAPRFMSDTDNSLPPGGDFMLTSADGPVALADLRGKAVLIYFGYATCPDVCPTSLALIATALRALTPAERERVRVLFVSVDPARDTPARLKPYATHFHPDIIGVTAQVSVLGEMARHYGAAFNYTPVSSATGYVVDHTSSTAVVAPNGRLVELLPHATAPPEIVAAIRRVLR